MTDIVLGHRIKQARKAAKKSLRALANDIDISAMAISKYERDIITPNSSVLLDMANVLGVQVEYFFRPSIVNITIPKDRHPSGPRVKDEAAITLRIEEYIERYIEVESLFPDKQPSFKINLHASTIDDAETAASRLRKQWNLGLAPIGNLSELLEREGIKIAPIDGGYGFDAITVYANGEPVIAIREDLPGDLQRSGLLLELAYTLLKNVVSQQEDITSVAGRFSRAFLTPAEVVQKALGKKRKSLSHHELYFLKHQYGMSMKSWVQRVFELGIITNKTRLATLKEFKRMGWHKEEPGTQLRRDVSHRFKRLVYRAISEGYISRSRADELLGSPTGWSDIEN
jgi:transcriptional regulator with XRE-family HTH domain/Zn-dependent peptidase ImmA (M78 family)